MARQSLWLSMNRLGINRGIVWFHRWAGVVLCLLFVAWFASGAVLHFVGFPSLPEGERVLGSESIDLSKVQIEPSAALAQVPHATELKLVSVAGRPVYLATLADEVVAIAADEDVRAPLPLLPPTMAQRVAEVFSQGPVERVDGPLDYDQWIVHHRFDPWRPFYRVRLTDDQHTELYVSARTGELLQRTRHDERVWNWCGAVLHWIYFTPVRKSWSVWDQVVWWVSLVALITTVAGFWLGILRFAALRALSRPGLSPFRGWLKWHHVIGLLSSIVVLGWIFSGWLSMDHGRLFSRGAAAADQNERMRAMPLAAVARAATLARLREIGPAAIVTFNAVASRPFLTVVSRDHESPRIIWLDGDEPSVTELPDELLLTALESVWPQASVTMASDSLVDTYRLAESVAPDALAADVQDDSRTLVYVDRSTGRLLAVMDPSRRAYAWVYYVLHTLKFPFLTSHELLRTIVVLLLLAVGLVFSVTALVLSVQRLKRDFA